MSDPFGHELFRKRLELSLQYVQEMLLATVPPVREPECCHFIVTGVGSSEAQARFFVYCINQFTSGTAEFWPLSSFVSLSQSLQHIESTLVVISQGISPNTHIAISKGIYFKDRLLFTASRNKDIIKDLKEEKWSLFYFPMEDEYDILIRIVGPLCGYVAIIQYISNAFINHTLPEFLTQQILNTIAEVNNEPIPFSKEDFIALRERGCVLIGTDSLPEYGYNLPYKFLEGLFVPHPSFIDLLSLCHGTLQELFINPKHVFLFLQDDAWQIEIAERAKKIIEPFGCPTISYIAKLPPPWSILEYEMLLNNMVSQGLSILKINQRNWPAFGLDKPLYEIHGI
ncbi:MAG: hypothetical protein COZ46_05670 [Verrucomicrobia bacterium CG_4_10_14_3_um_filter_43_23]|nr:MAG: hypothetical protein AUJ82_06790 [Verrucomicrobia bacterium CG1_02_43_26]PIP59899.1 MAG: hypothetical protein COX01_01225 [Verrucomicrobia bacterium CG22_combo_CG10-13_8_21_14_all_43_17]PIX58065.1 MAG: hypothetical protein COZ46_05670 [Verrucomicrobia bacterium CG_4_10_14_3_um_filter_43_23]PIY61160.1 MAG: hypothetical protein COY94_06625 [Verrucomicrobia bacterium CG_4_10_14_0_8_um_filter_43_34]PJA43333.1 MAG: hypothetical protein CO175_08515 [Verrucomicrobia bacterium CG_4_9_14_3_um_fi